MENSNKFELFMLGVSIFEFTLVYFPLISITRLLQFHCKHEFFFSKEMYWEMADIWNLLTRQCFFNYLQDESIQKCHHFLQTL